MKVIHLDTGAIPLVIELSASDERRFDAGEPIDWRTYKSQIETQCESAENNSKASEFMLRRIKALRAWLESE